MIRAQEAARKVQGLERDFDSGEAELHSSITSRLRNAAATGRRCLGFSLVNGSNGNRKEYSDVFQLLVKGMPDGPTWERVEDEDLPAGYYARLRNQDLTERAARVLNFAKGLGLRAEICVVQDRHWEYPSEDLVLIMRW